MKEPREARPELGLCDGGRRPGDGFPDGTCLEARCYPHTVCERRSKVLERGRVWGLSEIVEKIPPPQRTRRKLRGCNRDSPPPGRQRGRCILRPSSQASLGRVQRLVRSGPCRGFRDPGRCLARGRPLSLCSSGHQQTLARPLQGRWPAPDSNHTLRVPSKVRGRQGAIPVMDARATQTVPTQQWQGCCKGGGLLSHLTQHTLVETH